jgi:hypothetical protein
MVCKILNGGHYRLREYVKVVYQHSPEERGKTEKAFVTIVSGITWSPPGYLSKLLLHQCIQVNIVLLGCMMQMMVKIALHYVCRKIGIGRPIVKVEIISWKS